VSYEAVDKAVEAIWADNPMLVIHCGVAGRRKEICIETRARNGPYNKKDVLNKVLPGEFIKGPDELVTGCDGDLCVRRVDDSDLRTSNDAGLYLCEYIYYKSLLHCQNRADVACIFIHVPVISVISAENAASTITNVILEIATETLTKQ